MAEAGVTAMEGCAGAPAWMLARGLRNRGLHSKLRDGLLLPRSKSLKSSFCEVFNWLILRIAYDYPYNDQVAGYFQLERGLILGR